MDQDRRDAAAWAKEWQIKRKNRRLLLIIAGILLVVLIGYSIHVVIVHAERSTFGSEEEMRAAMQGRYARESDYTDIMIEGDDFIKTYLAYTHYNRDYAERYGYDYNEEDSVYDDRVVEWDYRNGVIRTEWMGEFVVDKGGNIHEKDDNYYTFYKTDEPRPDPIDPSTLNNAGGDIGADISEDDLEVLEEREENLEATEDAAEEAGVTGENTVDA